MRATFTGSMAAATAMVAALISGSGCSIIIEPATFGDGDAGRQHDSSAPRDAGRDAAPCPMMCDGACVDTTTDPSHCGSCGNACDEPENATAICTGGACGFTCNAGYARVLGECAELDAPRPLSPLSTSTVTSRRPTLRWDLAPRTEGARVQICEDRSCSSVLDTIDAAGTSVRVAAELPALTVVYWRLFSLADGVAGPSPSATWQMRVGARSADGDADVSWGTHLDVDGDGFTDVAVGAPHFTSPDDGAAYVYLGGLSGVSETPEKLEGPPDLNEEFGRAVTSAGDVNGDGFADLLVGAPSANEMDGAVFLFLGGPGRLGERRHTLQPPPAAVGGSFGLSVASAGDVNGDGYADVVVGAPGLSGGTVYVYHGTSTGLGDTPQTTLSEPDGLGGEFGWAVASAGDVDGDGFGDIAVGAPRVGADAGAVHVFYGSSSGIGPTSRRVALAGSPGERFGWAVAALDLDGNGFSDVVVGAPGASVNAGAVRVYSGGPGGLAASDPTRVQVIHGDAAGQFFGTMLSDGGDIDGDGFADLAVGSPDADSGAGRVHVYGGGPAGADPTDDTRNAELAAPSSGAFGVGLSAGDLDGDGLSDLIVGAPGVTGSLGAVFVFRGGAGAGGVDVGRRQLLESPSTLPSFFGRSVAGATR